MGAAVAAAAVLTAVLLLAGCGDDDSSSPDAEDGKGPVRVKVVESQFPADQQLGETALMRVGVRNVGDETLRQLTIAVSVGGEAGEASSLPFGVRDPQPELAEPDRPVWVLAEGYPRLAGSDERGGAETSTTKVFSLGPLRPGQVTEAVWKLTASRAGSYDIHYRIGAGPGDEVRVETDGGVPAGGSFAVTISDEPVDTTVTADGRIVEIGEQGNRGG